MIAQPSSNPRSGYTSIVVLIFLFLLFALWSTVYRTTSSLLRVETNRVLQQTRDQGAMNVLAQAIQLLQYSTPSTPGNPGRTLFTYGVQVTIAEPSGAYTTSDFTVEFSPVPAQGPSRWQVQVSPGSYSVPLPAIGATPQWP